MNSNSNGTAADSGQLMGSGWRNQARYVPPRIPTGVASPTRTTGRRQCCVPPRATSRARRSSAGRRSTQCTRCRRPSGANGRAVVVWQATRDDNAMTNLTKVYAAIREPGEAFGPAQVIGADAGRYESTDVTVASDGSIDVAYRGIQNVGSVARTRRSPGTPRPAVAGADRRASVPACRSTSRRMRTVAAS
jgi:hypothetical protein